MNKQFVLLSLTLIASPLGAKDLLEDIDDSLSNTSKMINQDTMEMDTMKMPKEALASSTPATLPKEDIFDQVAKEVAGVFRDAFGDLASTSRKAAQDIEKALASVEREFEHKKLGIEPPSQRIEMQNTPDAIIITYRLPKNFMGTPREMKIKDLSQFSINLKDDNNTIKITGHVSSSLIEGKIQLDHKRERMTKKGIKKQKEHHSMRAFRYAQNFGPLDVENATATVSTAERRLRITIPKKRMKKITQEKTVQITQE